MNPFITIKNRRIGLDYAPLVVAEIGINHNGSLSEAFKLVDAAQKAGAVTVNWGLFVNAIISFLIVAFAVFMLIKAMNTLQSKLEAKEKKAAAAAAPTTKVCPYCCTEIPVDAKRCPHCTSELKKK